MQKETRAALLAIIVAGVFVTTSYARQNTDQVAQPTTATAQVPVQQLPGTAPAAPTSGPTQSAVPVKEVPSPAAPSHALDQALWALAVSYILKKLMSWDWFKWVTPEATGRVKAAWGFAAAMITAAGIHFVVTGSVLDGGLNISVTGISLDAIKDIGWQWVSQQAWYDAIVKDKVGG